MKYSFSKNQNDQIAINEEQKKSKNSFFIVLKQGENLFKQNKFHEALDKYNQALSIFDNIHSIYYNKSCTLSRLNQIEEALKACDQAIQIDPKNHLFYSQKGIAFNLSFGTLLQSNLLKINEEALKCCDISISLNMQNPQAYNIKAFALNNLQKYEECLENYTITIQQEPKYIEALINKGNVLLLLNRFEEGINIYQSCIDLDPNIISVRNQMSNYFILYNLAICLINMNKLDEALNMTDYILNIHPQYINAAVNKVIFSNILAAILKQTQMKKFDVIKLLKYSINVNSAQQIRVEQLNYQGPELYINKIFILQNQGQIEQAINQCNILRQTGYKQEVVDSMIKFLSERKNN